MRLVHKGLVLLIGLTACANPVPPSGGPPDRTPPALVESTPPPNATNVQDPRIRLVFSEGIDPASVARALSITPAPERPPKVRVRGRTVTFSLPTPLRSNTTYVLTFDTDLRDLHGVSLREPIVLAFSTGPTINRGQLVGRVLDAASGQPVANIDVYAYALTDSLPLRTWPPSPDYRTQTDPEGRFQFAYLSDQRYFVIALADRNRNRQPDPGEAFAAPPHPALQPDTSGQLLPTPWLITHLDTLPPILRQVRPLSNRRLQVRFSEPVRLQTRDPSRWLLFTPETAIPIQAVYQVPARPFDVLLYTPPLQPVTHWLRAGGVVDTAGNPVRPDTVRFTGLARRDTLRLRFLGFIPGAQARLLPNQLLQLRFNLPPPDLAAYLTLTDTTGRPRAFRLESADGTTYTLIPDPPLRPGEQLHLTLEGRISGHPDTLWHATLTLMPAAMLGSLSGVVQAADTTAPVIVELLPETPALPVQKQRLPPGGGTFHFESLPEGRFRVRAFLDYNGNQRWDGGQLLPYAPPEPLSWLPEPLQTRPRWEIAAGDTLRFSRLHLP
ncbi:Ig-like domain-containing protein [Rhodothermus profundi]|uniref:Ig-like domain-containing protein n=1 Tax=Rhodothermus profundi TaxID=633813 RepID=A0A1M6XQ83_9BACT|nr:Ig-like domain-containing protein [Rhodothermus profundi]SHL07955.1 Ig-like domain-containing protein [Rhodothermus profundi]